MAFFQYTARDAQGTLHRGLLDVDSEREAARKLKTEGLFPVQIKAVKSHRFQRIPEWRVIGFFKDLSDLLEAGLGLDNALALIATTVNHKGFKAVIHEILNDLQGGRDFSETIARYADIFGTLATPMIRAGEASGTLPSILKTLSEHLERYSRFRRSIVSALIYPAVLIGVSAISVFIMLVYVVPKFAQIFQDLHQQVPFTTRCLLGIGMFLKDYGWAVAGFMFAAFWTMRLLRKKPHARRTIDFWLLKLPISRKFLLPADLARFCQTLGTLLIAGVPLVRALSMVEELVLNTALREILRPLKQEVKVGHPVSGFFRSKEIFPVRITTMLRIAEEQGNLGKGMLELGKYFEQELQDTLHRVVALLEPAVIIVTAIVIGIIVMSIFSAIYGVTEIRF